MNIVDVRIWCGALVHHGKPFLAAWLFDKWEVPEGKLLRIQEIRVHGANHVAPIRAEGIAEQELLTWWEKVVCAPLGVVCDWPAIHRRRLRLLDLLEEAERLDERIRKVCDILGNAAPSHVVRHICAGCIDEYRQKFNEAPDEMKVLQQLEAQTENELRRMRRARRALSNTKGRKRANGR